MTKIWQYSSKEAVCIELFHVDSIFNVLPVVLLHVWWVFGRTVIFYFVTCTFDDRSLVSNTGTLKLFSWYLCKHLHKLSKEDYLQHFYWMKKVKYKAHITDENLDILKSSTKESCLQSCYKSSFNLYNS